MSGAYDLSCVREYQQYLLIDVDYEQIVEELLGLLTKFFSYAANNEPSVFVENSERSIYTTSYVTLVLFDVLSIMHAVPHSPSITQRFNSHLESIAKEVRKHRYTGDGDYLFWIASLYISRTDHIRDGVQWCDINSVAHELREYKKMSDSRDSEIKRQYLEALETCMLAEDDNFSWDFLDRLPVHDQPVSLIPSSSNSSIAFLKGIHSTYQVSQSYEIADDEVASKLDIASNEVLRASDHGGGSSPSERGKDKSRLGTAFVESPRPSSPSTAHVAINVVDPVPSPAGIPSPNVP